MGNDLWQQRAGLPGLQSVLDPLDRGGGKNRYIDQLQREALRRGVGFAPGQRVLDLGCGVGRLTKWLARDGRMVVGVELSSAMVAEARRAVTIAAFVRYGGTDLPFDSDTFDRVVIVGVLQHVLEEKHLGSVLSEVWRVTRPQGRVGIIEQVRRHGAEVSGYIKHRTHRAYLDAFESSGFKVIRDHAIRAPIGFTALAARGLLPRIVWPATVQVDQWIAGPASALTYADRLMVFEKV